MSLTWSSALHTQLQRLKYERGRRVESGCPYQYCQVLKLVILFVSITAQNCWFLTSSHEMN
jgi:hypothetical protein